MEDDDLVTFERSLRHAFERYRGDPLDAALDELGWHDALSTDRRTAVSLAFGLQGAANASSSCLGHVIALGLGVGRIGGPAIVLPPIGQWQPPGSVVGGTLEVRGLGLAAMGGEASALVVARDGDREIIFAVPTGSLHLRPVEGVDPSLALLEVTGRGVTCNEEVGAGASWDSAVALGRLAVAHELVGASRRMLELACRHAGERVQFGRPIRSFQAVRHRLAETLVGIEAAEALLEAAWIDPSPTAVAMAKAMAGRQARTAARHSQQVLAGIGFTMEHPLHRYVRRTLLLDGIFGTAESLTRLTGRDMADRRRLAPLLPL